MHIASSAAFNANVFGSDGQVGTFKDILFDDETWEIRYLVVDTGTWLSVNKVLIDPSSVQQALWDRSQVVLNLTSEKIKSSPPIETDKPVSRRLIDTLHGHYAWPAYAGTTVPVPMEVHEKIADQIVAEDEFDPRLRSANEVTGYYVEATDGDVGHVEEFIVDDQTWRLSYIIVDTRNWLPGKKVVVDPKWADDIDWHENKFRISITKNKFENAPEFDPSTPINRRYEKHLYDFYGRPHYSSEK